LLVLRVAKFSKNGSKKKRFQLKWILNLLKNQKLQKLLRKSKKKEQTKLLKKKPNKKCLKVPLILFPSL